MKYYEAFKLAWDFECERLCPCSFTDVRAHKRFKSDCARLGPCPKILIPLK